MLNSHVETEDVLFKSKVFALLSRDQDHLWQIFQEIEPNHAKFTKKDIKKFDFRKHELIMDFDDNLGIVSLDQDGKNDQGYVIIQQFIDWDDEYRGVLALNLFFPCSLLMANGIPTKCVLIYTGKTDIPDEIHTNHGSIIAHVRHVIKQASTETLLGQYIGFCKIFNSYYDEPENFEEIVPLVVNECKSKGYLSEFLKQETVEQILKDIKEIKSQKKNKKS